MHSQLNSHFGYLTAEYVDSTERSKYRTYVRAIALCLILQSDGEKKLDDFLHKKVSIKTRKVIKNVMSDEFKNIFWWNASKAYNFLNGGSKLKYSTYELFKLKQLFNTVLWEREMGDANLSWLFSNENYKEMTVLEFLMHCKNKSEQSDREDWFKKLKKYSIWSKKLSDFKGWMISVWLDANITNKEIEIFEEIFLTDEICIDDIADFIYL